MLKAPAAQQLTAQQLLQLTLFVLRRAVELGDDELMPLVVELSAAQQWDEEAVEHLLLCAIRERYQPSISALLLAPFAAPLSAACVARLLLEAIQRGLEAAANI